jgi:carboxymethylenebutenolidase
MATTRWVQVATVGGQVDAFVATPPVTPGPGILLIQEIFGVNDHIQGVAAQYASDGYTVIAPDLFWRSERRINIGYSDAEFKRGMQLAGQLDPAKTAADIAAAVKALRSLPECKGPVTSLGYCMGGRLSYRTAATGDVDSAICYYGGGIGDELQLAAKIRCPILFHFGEQDQWIPRTVVDGVKAAFTGHDAAAVHLYPGVGHGFNCWARSAYNQRAAALARGRSLEFLSAR